MIIDREYRDLDTRHEGGGENLFARTTRKLTLKLIRLTKLLYNRLGFDQKTRPKKTRLLSFIRSEILSRGRINFASEWKVARHVWWREHGISVWSAFDIKAATPNN